MVTHTEQQMSSTTLSRHPVVRNLLAAAEHLADFPSLTVGEALDALSLPFAGIPADLIDLPGALACEAIEAELLVLSGCWTSNHREAA